MRFFLVIALALPLMAAEFSNDEFSCEEDDENGNNPTYTCSSPPSPPADTTTDTKDKLIRGATRTFTPFITKALSDLSMQQNKKFDPKEEQGKPTS